jgi:uncharacterized protein YodC (DUF2158 family)
MSEERIFKVGDVVILKSGGPKMTVLATGEGVRCVWFVKGGEELEKEDFLGVCLRWLPQESA